VGIGDKRGENGEQEEKEMMIRRGGEDRDDDKMKGEGRCG